MSLTAEDSDGRGDLRAGDATMPDVRQLRERFGAVSHRGSPERNRSLAAVERALFGAAQARVQVGRFVLDERLGAGAMGIVYAAHDPRLDRKVAVKVLHPQTDPQARQENVARLLREAKTLARLTHPNVVAVHEVGETDDGLFIAMQFVDGSNLGAWLRARPRPWPEVLRLFLGAGAGLAAAHRQGLVHRDFKPDNVLVDKDGHPRVADFGLACSALETHPTAPDDEDVSMLRVTQTGTLLGTPAYMAPELFEGQSADALSDQYSFCVAFYEALYGVRPFGGDTLLTVIDNARTMQLAAPREGRDAPAWLRRAVIRGLSPEPSDRFADMHALVAQLERGRHRRRRVVLAGFAGVAGVSVLAAVVSYGVGARQSSGAQCPTTEALRDSVWDDAQRDALARSFGADERPYVGHSAEGTLRELDAWARGWADARSDACRATHERAEQSPALLDLRVQCYELAATRMHALIDAMTTRSDAMDDAPVITSVLPDLRLCADPQWVQARRPLPRGAEARDRIEAVSKSVAQAQVLHYAGRLDEALALAQDALAEAQQLDYAPLAADALQILAKTHSAAGRPEEAETALTRAMTEALSGGDEWRAAHAAIELIDSVGTDGKRKAERERWTTVAEGIITKLGSPVDLRGELALTEAMALREEGDLPGALAAGNEALQCFTESRGDEHAKTAHAHEEIGITLDMMGRPSEGIVHVERSLAVERKVWGAEHPRVGTSLVNLGILYAQLGRTDDCAAAFERGLAILESAYGPDSIMIVGGLTNLAGARELQQRYEEGLALNVRAREIRERVYGPDHVEVAVNMANGGSLLTSLGRYEEALEWLEPALRIRVAQLGADHPAVGHAHLLLGSAYAGVERFDEARKHGEQAIEVWSATLGADHPSVGAAMVTLGEIEVNAGDHEAGVERMQGGISVVAAARGDDHRDVAIARQQLARAREAAR